MDVGSEITKWVPPAVLYALLIGCISVFVFIAVKVAGLISFIVNKTYKEIMTMLREIQEKMGYFEGQLADVRYQFKDGINELKIQMERFVPAGNFNDTVKEIKDDLVVLREKIARLENR